MANEEDSGADAEAAAKKKERARKAAVLAKAKGEGQKKKAPSRPVLRRSTSTAPPRLKAKYDQAIRPEMMKEFSYSTISRCRGS